MKHPTIMIIVTLTAVCLFYYGMQIRPGFHNKKNQNAQVADVAVKDVTNHDVNTQGDLPPVIIRSERPVHPLSVSFGKSGTAPEREPEILLEILNAFRQFTGAYPVAEDNREMMKILTGKRGAIRLFPENHARFNARGELIDGWGTPFFFHCISRTHLEVRSAGPDTIMYTEDDVMVPIRPPAAPL